MYPVYTVRRYVKAQYSVVDVSDLPNTLKTVFSESRAWLGVLPCLKSGLSPVFSSRDKHRLGFAVSWAPFGELKRGARWHAKYVGLGVEIRRATSAVGEG